MADPADAGPARTAPQRRRRWKRALAEMAITILVAVLLADLVRTFAFQRAWPLACGQSVEGSTCGAGKVRSSRLTWTYLHVWV